MRRQFLQLAALACLAPRLAVAQQKFSYRPISPEQHTYSPGQIEVVEFFWYGCPHCYNLEPFIEKWLAKKPKDVAFVRLPAILDDDWARDAAIFYSLDAMGLIDKLHRPLFDAIHRSRLRTDNQAALDEWLGKNGVDPKKFKAVFTSPTIESAVVRAKRLTAAYRVDGTPAMAVQGKYYISARDAGDQQYMLDTVDYVVGIVRKEMAPAPKGKKK
jgi:thiol:disulfide interchange protein DsbA